jgi:hypothetical protein
LWAYQDTGITLCNLASWCVEAQKVCVQRRGINEWNKDLAYVGHQEQWLKNFGLVKKDVVFVGGKHHVAGLYRHCRENCSYRYG